MTGAGARTQRGGRIPLGHWAFLPDPDAGVLGAVRVRIYRPLVPGADTVARVSWAAEADAGTALVREVYQGTHRCIEEHWWPPGAVPAGLIPEDPPEPRTFRLPFQPGTSAAAQTAILLAALDIALRDERRAVASVAARFDSAPGGLLSGTLRISAGTEGRIRLDVEPAAGPRVMRAAVWFGCGARPLPWRQPDRGSYRRAQPPRPASSRTGMST